MPESLTNTGYSDPLKPEKINGVIYNMNAGSSRHAETVANILSTLVNFFSGKHCKLFTSELDIHLDADNTYRPDVSVICEFSNMRDNGYHGAPALVVEVLSPSTANRDRGDKFDNYQRYGVTEYLIVNPDYQSIEQYALIDEVYKLQAIYFRPGTSFNSYAFEGLKFELDTIFEFRQD